MRIVCPTSSGYAQRRPDGAHGAPYHCLEGEVSGVSRSAASRPTHPEALQGRVGSSFPFKGRESHTKVSTIPTPPAADLIRLEVGCAMRTVCSIPYERCAWRTLPLLCRLRRRGKLTRRYRPSPRRHLPAGPGPCAMGHRRHRRRPHPPSHAGVRPAKPVRPASRAGSGCRH